MWEEMLLEQVRNQRCVLFLKESIKGVNDFLV